MTFSLRTASVVALSAATLTLGLTACTTDDADKEVTETATATETTGTTTATATDSAEASASESVATETATETATATETKAVEMVELDGQQVPADIAAKIEELGGVEKLDGISKVTKEGDADVVYLGEHRRVYFTPETGAHLIQGKILETWIEQGGVDSDLGLPTSDEKEITNGWQSDFQKGQITWTSATGEIGDFQPTIVNN